MDMKNYSANTLAWLSLFTYERRLFLGFGALPPFFDAILQVNFAELSSRGYLLLDSLERVPLVFSVRVYSSAYGSLGVL